MNYKTIVFYKSFVFHIVCSLYFFTSPWQNKDIIKLWRKYEKSIWNFDYKLYLLGFGIVHKME